MEDVQREFNYTITIRPSDNGGAIVKIGCATLAFEGTVNLIQGLETYFSNPQMWEKKYNELAPDAPAEVAQAEAAPNPTQEAETAS